MNKILYLLVAFVILNCGCNHFETKTTSSPKPDDFYHYSIWTALVNKIYDGTLTVAEGKTKGDIGLGTYNGADGELIMVDGIMYHVPSTGEVRIATDRMHIPYLN
jgi:acetolactate decarboxylase